MCCLRYFFPIKDDVGRADFVGEGGSKANGDSPGSGHGHGEYSCNIIKYFGNFGAKSQKRTLIVGTVTVCC